MAKAKKTAQNTGIVPPETQAIARASNIKSLRAEIEQKQTELKSLEMEQIDFMEGSNLSEFEGFSLVEVPGRIKWDGLKGKQLDYAIDQILNVVDKTLVKESIDTSKMFIAVKSDVQMQSFLKTLGLQLVQGESSKSLRTKK